MCHDSVDVLGLRVFYGASIPLEIVSGEGVVRFDGLERLHRLGGTVYCLGDDWL